MQYGSTLSLDKNDLFWTTLELKIFIITHAYSEFDDRFRGILQDVNKSQLCINNENGPSGICFIYLFFFIHIVFPFLEFCFFFFPFMAFSLFFTWALKLKCSPHVATCFQSTLCRQNLWHSLSLYFGANDKQFEVLPVSCAVTLTYLHCVGWGLECCPMPHALATKGKFSTDARFFSSWKQNFSEIMVNSTIFCV